MTNSSRLLIADDHNLIAEFSEALSRNTINFLRQQNRNWSTKATS